MLEAVIFDPQRSLLANNVQDAHFSVATSPLCHFATFSPTPNPSHSHYKYIIIIIIIYSEHHSPQISTTLMLHCYKVIK